MVMRKSNYQVPRGRSTVGRAYSNFKKRENMLIDNIDKRKTKPKKINIKKEEPSFVVSKKTSIEVPKKEKYIIKENKNLSPLELLVKFLRDAFPKEEVDLAIEKISYIDLVKYESYDKTIPSISNLMNGESHLNKKLNVVSTIRKGDKKYYY